MKPKLWTLQLKGGNPIHLQIPLNPPLEHDGKVTLFTLLASKTSLQIVLEILKANKIRCEHTTLEILPEQEKEKELLLAAQRNEMVFLCVECSNCFWLDLKVPKYCGFINWDKNLRETALKHHEKAQKDLEICTANIIDTREIPH